MLVAVCREADSINCAKFDWVAFEKLHQDQYWHVSQLEPETLATAFGAGFITLGTILIVVKTLSVVLSLLK